MNSPMPMVMDCLIDDGMALTSAILNPLIVSARRMKPSIKIAVSANCHECPIARQTVKTKKAFGPIPGAIPNGIFATTAIMSVLMMATRAVAVKTAPAGIPSRVENIPGLTARIYDIVRNDVIPANISVRTVLFCGSNPNNLFSISFCLIKFSASMKYVNIGQKKI